MTDTNGTILESLRRRRREIEAQRDELTSFWEHLNVVIEDYERSGRFDKLLEDTKKGIVKLKKAPGLTEFIRYLFNTQSEKKWRRVSLMAEATSASVRTKGNLGNNIYSVLQRLMGQNEIEPGGSPRKRWYRKKQTVDNLIE